MARRYGSYSAYLLSTSRWTWAWYSSCWNNLWSWKISSYIQNKENVYDLEWTKGGYGDMIPLNWKFKYSFELADLDKHFKWFDEYEEEAVKNFDKGLVMLAYDYVLNVLMYLIF